MVFFPKYTMIPVAKPYLTRDEAKVAYKTILSGWVTQGPRVAEFEEKFAKYVGTEYAVAVSSCTAALHLALLTAGIKTGHEVICPSLSFIATANAIKYVGATPVFADVDARDGNISPEQAERLITKKTTAILIVHQLGFPADIDAFKKICKKHHLQLIEDAACAAGASYKNKKIGTHSDLVCFSFHPRKVITTGDGGMITTSNRKYYKRLKLLRQHGMSVNDLKRHQSKKIIKEEYLELGYNYRMTDIQAAIGIKQLEKLDWLISERRKIAKRYFQALQNISCLQLPQEIPGRVSNFQSFQIFLKDNCPIKRDEIMQNLLNRGIVTRHGVMTIHTAVVYKNLCKNLHLPVSDKLSSQSIILPLYVPMKNQDFNKIVREIWKIFSINY